MKFYITHVLLFVCGSLHAQVNHPRLKNDKIESGRDRFFEVQSPEGMSGYWNDTIVRICAHRIPNGGSALSPWWFESSTYVGSQLMNVYSSYYTTNMVYYYRQDFIYNSANEKEVSNYSSSDSVNWVLDVKSRIREFQSVSVDSSSTYDWNAGMNKWIPSNSQATYKTSNSPDSTLVFSLGAPSSRVVWYRNNGNLDSIVEYGYDNGSWVRSRWEHFYGLYSLSQSNIYPPTKRWRNVYGEVIALLNYDSSGQRTDSTFNYLTNSVLDSTVQFDANNVFYQAVGYRKAGSIQKLYNWNSQLVVSSYSFRYSNVNGVLHGVEGFNSNGQLRSKWGICEAYNSLSNPSYVKELILYPNPNWGSFRIDGLTEGEYLLELWDLHGHLLEAIPIESANQVEVQMRGHAAGIYRAVVYGKDGQVTLPVYVRY